MPGFELTAKWREGKRIVYQFQSETWYRNQENSLASTMSGFISLQSIRVHPLYLFGISFDGYKELSKTNALTNKKINHIEYGLVPELTWKSSELLHFELDSLIALPEKKESRLRKILASRLRWFLFSVPIRPQLLGSYENLGIFLISFFFAGALLGN